MFAAGRFEDVQKGLRANTKLISSRGVTTNRFQLDDGIRNGPTGVITMDGEERAQIKRLLMKPLIPKALQTIKDRVEAEAKEVVRRFCIGKEVEGMATIASHLPVTVVAELVGLNSVGGEQLLHWAATAFNSFGPPEKPLAPFWASISILRALYPATR
ncbi:cytochrome P450 [Sphingobium xenophagum]|uniref:Cytochrome P450 n=1 Tax=Sphingobium xenophagum TaxID=121428 RepID=A0ABU1X723_SPHXE|nr:hypothetical protein [Sphingobium xenophagum]MDR7156857.1 cytochrome P450 [Sphingobium xenophagum]